MVNVEVIPGCGVGHFLLGMPLPEALAVVQHANTKATLKFNEQVRKRTCNRFNLLLNPVEPVFC